MREEGEDELQHEEIQFLGKERGEKSRDSDNDNKITEKTMAINNKSVSTKC
jgi:hypothetical protein